MNGKISSAALKVTNELHDVFQRGDVDFVNRQATVDELVREGREARVEQVLTSEEQNIFSDVEQ